MKKTNVIEENGFGDKAMKKLLVHDSPYFRIINFNFKAGQELAIHDHPVEGQLSLAVLSGEGFFLGEGGAEAPAKTGDICVCDIAEPHGYRATRDTRLLVTIAPPL